MKYKYKVGDKVRVRDDLVLNKIYGKDNFVEAMADTLGQVVEIQRAVDGKYFIKGSNYNYTEEMFEKPILAVNYDGSLNLDAKEDLINNPKHYTTGGIETIDFIEAKNLNFRLANAVKYLTRAEHKGSKLSDLKKAIWYIQREIDKSESVE